MKQRKYLYGYTIQNGEYILVPEEAATVNRIFSLYEMGESYAAIAGTLRRDSIPYDETPEGWNKHTIKRILENRRYAGKEPYPAVIDQKQFDRVQDLIAQKGTRRGYQQNPRINLWTYMQCEKCGQRLIHGKRLPNGKNYFKCPECGVIIRIAHKDLTRNIVSQINGTRTAEETYKPSPEVIRLETQINRALDSGTKDTDQVISLILSGIAERYKCCVSDSETAPYADLSDIDPRQFSGIVSAVTLTTEGNISVKLK